MGIRAILLFALFSIELYYVVHGADLPTTSKDAGRDLPLLSGKTAHGFEVNDAVEKKAEDDYSKWINFIGQDSVSNNVNESSVFENGSGSEDNGAVNVITVAKTGVSDFRRIQDAVNSVPDNNPVRTVIYIHSGVYKEKVVVPENKSRITFQGQGKRSTIITWHDDAFTLGKDGKPLGIFESATVAVKSDYFVAANISFQNSASNPRSLFRYRQAVALTISGDMAMFLSCGVFGHQDTLFDNEGRHYFYNCTIKGSVDFIFGNGKSIYERCVLRSLTQFGAITAQGRSDPTDPTGFAFVNCRISGSGHPFLGRAWGDFSRVVYVHSSFDIHFDSQAWSDFGHPQRRSTSFYGMYKCKGPGAKIAMKSTWTKELTYQQARPFVDLSFINGGNWIRPFSSVTIDATSALSNVKN